MKYSFLDHEPFKVGDKVRVRKDFAPNQVYRYRNVRNGRLKSLIYNGNTVKTLKGRQVRIIEQCNYLTAYKLDIGPNLWIAEEVLEPCNGFNKLLDNHNEMR